MVKQWVNQSDQRYLLAIGCYGMLLEIGLLYIQTTDITLITLKHSHPFTHSYNIGYITKGLTTA